MATTYIKNCYFGLNSMVVARLLRLIFLRKILARKHATFHIHKRYAKWQKRTPNRIPNWILKKEKKQHADFLPMIAPNFSH